MVGQSLDAQTLRSWILVSRDALGRHRVEIDALNVFPVPDGDTGTNMYLTMDAALTAADERDPAATEPGPMLDAVARAALLGARGNSGVILSQLLRGLAEVIDSVDRPDDKSLACGLQRAAELAYAAVGRPVEGTILTVARIAGEAAGRVAGEGLAAVATAAASSAREALARTPEQLPALAAAGVVDAGGKGLVVALDALEQVFNGHAADVPGAESSPVEETVVMPHVMPPDYDGPRYEVMFLLDADDDRILRLRARLDDLGDSLVVVGGGGLWNVHIHTDLIGQSVEVGIEAGRPHRIAVTDLIEQRRAREGAQLHRAVVAVAHGAGVAELLRSSGAYPVMAPPRGRPSTRDFLVAVQSSGAREAVLLPSDGDSTPVAKAAAEFLRDDDVRVTVVPSRSVVQTLAAVAVHDPDHRFDDDVVTMTRAASATRYGGVTVASREALTAAGRCDIGDVLGLVDGDIVEIGSDVSEVTLRVVDRMRGPASELLTLVLGDRADPGLPDVVRRYLQQVGAWLDVDVVPGGQPHWPVIIGVE